MFSNDQPQMNTTKLWIVITFEIFLILLLSRAQNNLTKIFGTLNFLSLISEKQLTLVVNGGAAKVIPSRLSLSLTREHNWMKSWSQCCCCLLWCCFLLVLDAALWPLPLKKLESPWWLLTRDFCGLNSLTLWIKSSSGSDGRGRMEVCSFRNLCWWLDMAGLKIGEQITILESQ